MRKGRQRTICEETEPADNCRGSGQDNSAWPGGGSCLALEVFLLTRRPAKQGRACKWHLPCTDSMAGAGAFCSSGFSAGGTIN
jgi:hypothetical protein